MPDLYSSATADRDRADMVARAEQTRPRRRRVARSPNRSRLCAPAGGRAQVSERDARRPRVDHRRPTSADGRGHALRVSSHRAATAHASLRRQDNASYNNLFWTQF